MLLSTVSPDKHCMCCLCLTVKPKPCYLTSFCLHFTHMPKMTPNATPCDSNSHKVLWSEGQGIGRERKGGNPVKFQYWCPRSPSHFSYHTIVSTRNGPSGALFVQGREGRVKLGLQREQFGDRRSKDTGEFLGKACWLEREERRVLMVFLHRNCLKGRKTGSLEFAQQLKRRPKKVNRRQMRDKTRRASAQGDTATG